MTDNITRVPQRSVTRGKDLALKTLEAARDPARRAVSDAEGDLRMARYQLENAERNLAVARRDRDDLEKAIEAVRAIPTASLQEYRKAAKGYLPPPA